MADSGETEYRIPNGLARDIDKSKAQMDIKIPNLEVKFKLLGKVQPKDNCRVEHDFTDNSFDIKATVTHDGVENKFRYKVGKLPGKILPDKCSNGIEFKKEYIIVTLYKAETQSWAVDIEHHALVPQRE